MIHIPDWKRAETFPASHGVWAVRDRRGTRSLADADITVLARKVSSQMGVGGPLISSPATQRFLPAIRVPELQESIISMVAGKLKMLVGIVLAFAVVCAVLLATGRAAQPSILVRLLLLNVLIAVYWLYNHRVAMRDRDVFVDWTILLDWQRRFAGGSLIVALAVLAAFGLLQVGFALAGYQRDFLFHQFGVVFAAVDRGEHWRFLVGPLLHGSVAHGVMNFLFCLLVLTYLTPFRHRWSVLLLGYLAVVLSGVAVYTQHRLGLGAGPSDSFAGVSALIYFACGLAWANALTHADWYPRGYARILLLSTIILLASPHALDGNISFVAHATGLLIGVLCGIGLKPGRSGSMGLLS